MEKSSAKRNKYKVIKIINKKNSLIFSFFCLILIVNPIPLGSNRNWAWSVEAMSLMSLMVLMLLCSMMSKSCINWSHLTKIKMELSLMLVWILIHFLYIIPLPIGLLEIISPHVAQSYKDLALTSGYLSLDVHASYLTMMLGIYYSMIFIVGYVLIDSRKRIKIVLILFLLLGVFESIYGMYLVSIKQTGLLVQLNTVSMNNASGTFINKNHLVAFLSLCFFMGLAYKLILMRKEAKYLESSYALRIAKFVSHPARLVDLCLFLILMGIWNTHSRAGLVSFLLSALLLLSLLIMVRKKKTNIMKIITLTVLAGIFMLVFAADDFTYILQTLGLDQSTSTDRVMNSAQGRLLAVTQFFKYFPDYWSFGVGPGAYQVFFVNHRFVEQTAFFDHAHNDYIEFLIEYGLLSLVLFMLLVLFMIKIVKMILNSKSIFYKYTGACVIASVFYLLIHGLMDFNARIPANVVTIIVAISVIYRKTYTLIVK